MSAMGFDDMATSKEALRTEIALEGDERIPASARMSSLPRLGITWTGVLLSPTAILVGILVTQKAPDGGFPLGIAGLITGYALGAIAMGWLSTWGPRTGLGQMAINRLALGRGNVLPQVILVVSLVLWSTLNIVYGVSALATALNVPFDAALAVAVIAQGLTGFLGYRALERLTLGITITMSLVLLALVIGAVGQTPPMVMFGDNGFVDADMFAYGVALGLGATYSWTIQATDTSRNLPEGTSPRRTFWTVSLSMFVPLSVLGFIGGWIGTAMAVDAPMERLAEVLGGGLVATVCLTALGFGLVAENSYNDVSNVITLRSLGLRVQRRTLAVISAFAVGAIAFVVHRFPLGDLTEFGGLVLGYFCAPLFGILLVELVYRRRQLQPWLIPAPAPISATIAFVVSFVLLFTFTQSALSDDLAMSTPAFAWVGSVPRLVLHGIEGGYFAGTLLAVFLYVIMRPIEIKRRQHSQRERSSVRPQRVM